MTFDQIEKILLGGVGLSVSEFDRMTVSQVLNAYNGYLEQEKERNKALQIVTWESIRWQTFILWNLHVTKKGKINDPRKLLKFDWDVKPERPKKEEWDKIVNLFPDKPRNGNK